MTIQPHELHNQAKDIIIEILGDYYRETDKDLASFLFLIETTIAASILLLTIDYEAQLKILDILAKGVKERLEEIKNKGITH